MYLGTRSASAALALFLGYDLARKELGHPTRIWEEILDKAKRMLHPEPTSFSLQMILVELSNNDDQKAFDLLRNAVEQILILPSLPEVK
jgi:hypothetical protein